MSMKYPQESAELIDLLEQDQIEWKAYAKAEYANKLSPEKLQKLKKSLREKVVSRGDRALEILSEIEGIPSLDAIGKKAAVALSVLATHHSLTATKRVLAAFEDCYILSPSSTHISSIPAMTDWVALLEHRPQKFGAIWLFDHNGYPFLPTVEDFESVNERREKYGIGPLRWPKSLAIPEKDQHWLKQPISELITRSPTKAELEKLAEYNS